MAHYKANTRDLRFTLFEMLGRQELLGSGPWADLDRSDVESMLTELQRLAEQRLAESFSDAAHGDVEFDPTTHTVRLPETFREAYRAYIDGEWWRIGLDEAVGGTPVPPSVRWALAELVLGANPATFIYAAGGPHAQVLHDLGTEDQRKLAVLMAERGWGATMVLTEPDAGSAVGAGRARAVPQPDGTWHIEGVKRFITSAEHDLTENIIHFVLARPVGVEGAGGPGTKGLSLFVVPKYMVDVDSGELGRRNGVLVTNVEHKMGLKVSATCEVTFGQDEPAVGFLVGEVHRGIAQMFEVVEYARMLVGTKAMATLSTAYLNALEYAKSRVQSADLTRRADKTAPDVPIVDHPDVRQSLMTQKAYVEGLRALVLFAASTQDDVAVAAADQRPALEAEALNDLLLPIVKGFISERTYVLLADALQVFGGSGYLQDYPMEQYIRDSKVDTIYEGTTAIQGLDLVLRKIVRDGGRALDDLLSRVQRQVDSGAPDGLKAQRQALGEALDAVRATTGLLTGWAAEAQADEKRIYLLGLNSTRLLMMMGELLVGWLLIWQADVALRALDEEPAGADAAFYRGKVAIARHFAATRLPLVVAEARVAADTDLDVMNVDIESL